MVEHSPKSSQAKKKPLPSHHHSSTGLPGNKAPSEDKLHVRRPTKNKTSKGREKNIYEEAGELLSEPVTAQLKARCRL